MGTSECERSKEYKHVLVGLSIQNNKQLMHVVNESDKEK